MIGWCILDGVIGCLKLFISVIYVVFVEGEGVDKCVS